MLYILPILTLILGYFFGRYIKLEISKKEQVNHPAHYQRGGKECIEVMEEEFGPRAVYWFCLLNSFKYNWRAGFKDGNSKEQDLAKAKWYREYAIKLFNKYPDIFNIPNGS
jgi:hypothetical protein